MPYFNEEELLVEQFSSHHGMLEIYVHLTASLLLFLVSIFCIAFIHKTFKKSDVEWPALIHGFFYTGLIGFGEAFEHLFAGDTFLNTVLHYLHLIAAPIAMIFFYLAIEEYHYKTSHPKEEMHSQTDEIAMGVFAGVLMVVIMMGSLAGSPWDERLEAPFLILITIPLLAITAVFIKKAEKIRKSMLTFYFPVLGVTLSGLAVVIWLGRLGYVNRVSSLYITAHSLQNVLHGATATIMILLVLAIREGIREDILYVVEVTKKAKPKKKAVTRKKFSVTEQ